jgi:hypothetical protein
VIGVFVDLWREGVQTRQQADDLIAWCGKNSITDIYLQVGRLDKGTLVNHPITWGDHIQYLIDSHIRIHAWINPLTVCRTVNKLSSAATSINDSWLKSFGGTEYLDPMLKGSQDYIIDRVSYYFNRYNFYGLNIDGLRYKVGYFNIGEGTAEEKSAILKSTMSRIVDTVRQIRPTEISLTVPMRDLSKVDLCDFVDWKTLYDFACPMVPVVEPSIETIEKWKLLNLPSKYVIFCYDKESAQAKIASLKDDIIFYSYSFVKEWL